MDRLQKHEGISFDSSNLNPAMLSDFTISKKGLSFTIPEGMFTAYAIGSPKTTIEFKRLKRMLSHKSVVYKLVRFQG